MVLYPPPELAGCNTTLCFATVTSISNPPLTCCKIAGTKYVMSQSRSTKSLNKPNTHRQNNQRIYTNQIFVLTSGGRRLRRRPPGDRYGMRISALVILCVGAGLFLNSLTDFLLRDCDTAYFGPAILQHVKWRDWK